ncbi:hypothetical protein HMPREF1979_01265 [Actinomyces johnsonii F0542]|uniref:Uncharacterized protein n=1 Tax=Actinomyces johnsonii F0542 TaxID=1321818 RepID=U1QS19_9ACTO|nr:hypothetical protein HMPREF1979_01265 [Actinomyces johnsonii F0542]
MSRVVHRLAQPFTSWIHSRHAGPVLPAPVALRPTLPAFLRET